MIVTTEDKKNVFLGVIQKIKKGLGNEENELVIDLCTDNEQIL